MRCDGLAQAHVPDDAPILRRSTAMSGIFGCACRQQTTSDALRRLLLLPRQRCTLGRLTRKESSEGGVGHKHRSELAGSEQSGRTMRVRCVRLEIRRARATERPPLPAAVHGGAVAFSRRQLPRVASLHVHTEWSDVVFTSSMSGTSIQLEGGSPRARYQRNSAGT